MSIPILEFASLSTTADSDLKRRVLAYLVSRSFRSFRRLDVEAHNGLVTLAGQLSTYYERQVAVESARRVAGALQVIDRITVPSDPVAAPPRYAVSGPRLSNREEVGAA